MTSTASPSNRAWKWLARLLFGLLLLGFLIWRGDTNPLRAALSSAPLWAIGVAVFSYWLAQLLSAWKWQWLLRARDAKISLQNCARWYLAGMFCNLWMPTNIGGDGARAYLAAPACGGLSVAVSSVFIERFTGFVALLILGVGGALWNHSTVGAMPLLIAAGLLPGAAVLYVLLRAWAASRRQSSPLSQKWLSLQAALEIYLRASQRPALLVALALSLLIQVAQIFINIGLARAVGLELPIATFFWLVPVLAVASILPLGIGGLGVREAAAVSLLASSGAATGTILAWSILWQATVWLSSLPGMFFMARKS